MAFDVEAAKADGYTDEEIAAYLRKEQGVPVAQQEEPGRGAEVAATLTSQIPAAASAAVGFIPEAATLYGAYKYGPDIIQAGKNIAGKMMGGAPSQPPMTGPVVPTTNAPPTTSAATRIPITTNSAPAMSAAPMTQVAPQAETGVINSARNIVQKLALDKVLKGAGIAAGAYEIGKGLFSTSPEEIEIMRQAEARKRAQGWKPLNER